MKVKEQILTNDYALYLGDSCEVVKTLPDEKVGLSIFSPPFFDLYSYSDDPRDLSNCKNYEEFLSHFGFLAEELFRISMPGRITAVHCMDLPTYKRGGEEIGLKDFPGDIVRLFLSKGFVYHSRHCIWKDPLVSATRTKAIGLAHKQLIKDSSVCRTGIPDYVLAFRKPGENPKPVKHPRGLAEYAGSRSLPRDLPTFENGDGYDGRKDKRSHWIWQQYASPVWFDIRQTYVLPYRDAKDDEDARHICPLQLDVIERCVTLWSGENDIVFTPFMGVGSEVYVAVKHRRKGIGIELKPSYFAQAKKNVNVALKDRQERKLETML